MTFFTLEMTIYLARKAWIAMLLVKEVIVLENSSDFANVLSKKLAKVLLKCTKINDYAIKLQKGKESYYSHIYSLSPVKLETLKTYIKINIANGFIWQLKSSIGTPIFLV